MNTVNSILLLYVLVVPFQKISMSTPRKVNRNTKGRGVSKAKILKGKYGAKLELSEGCGDSNKKSFLDGIWIFSGATHFYVTNGNFNCYLFLTHFNPLCIM